MVDSLNIEDIENSLFFHEVANESLSLKRIIKHLMCLQKLVS